MKATIYTTNEFFGNIVKQEVTLIDAIFTPYAQYKAALKVSFLPKRARIKRQFIKTYNPFVLIVKGHGHPNPEELFRVIKQDGDVM